MLQKMGNPEFNEIIKKNIRYAAESEIKILMN
jgi:hypothetical protein